MSLLRGHREAIHRPGHKTTRVSNAKERRVECENEDEIRNTKHAMIAKSNQEKSLPAFCAWQAVSATTLRGGRQRSPYATSCGEPAAMICAVLAS